MLWEATMSSVMIFMMLNYIHVVNLSALSDCRTIPQIQQLTSAAPEEFGGIPGANGCRQPCSGQVYQENIQRRHQTCGLGKKLLHTIQDLICQLLHHSQSHYPSNYVHL